MSIITYDPGEKQRIDEREALIRDSLNCPSLIASLAFSADGSIIRSHNIASVEAEAIGPGDYRIRFLQPCNIDNEYMPIVTVLAPGQMSAVIHPDKNIDEFVVRIYGDLGTLQQVSVIVFG